MAAVVKSAPQGRVQDTQRRKEEEERLTRMRQKIAVGRRTRRVKAGSGIQRQALLGGQLLLWLASKVPHTIGVPNVYL